MSFFFLFTFPRPVIAFFQLFTLSLIYFHKNARPLYIPFGIFGIYLINFVIRRYSPTIGLHIKPSHQASAISIFLNLSSNFLIWSLTFWNSLSVFFNLVNHPGSFFPASFNLSRLSNICVILFFDFFTSSIIPNKELWYIVLLVTAFLNFLNFDIFLPCLAVDPFDFFVVPTGIFDSIFAFCAFFNLFNFIFVKIFLIPPPYHDFTTASYIAHIFLTPS